MRGNPSPEARGGHLLRSSSLEHLAGLASRPPHGRGSSVVPREEGQCPGLRRRAQEPGSGSCDYDTVRGMRRALWARGRGCALRRVPLALIAVAISLCASGHPSPATRADGEGEGFPSAVAVVVGRSPLGPAIPRGFLGLSFEAATLHDGIFTPVTGGSSRCSPPLAPAFSGLGGDGRRGYLGPCGVLPRRALRHHSR